MQLATQEELLLEIVAHLRDAYEKDIQNQGQQGKYIDASIHFPLFMEMAKMKSEEFKENRSYGRLCSVPSFALGLVMASRIRRHYTHASWFNITTLTKMLISHGAVSGTTL